MLSGSLVAWKTVPASRESWRLQWLHWKVARAGGEAAEAGAAAAGAVEAVGPAGGEEGLLALRLGAVVLEELGQAEAFLELDFVLGHRRGFSSHDYRNIFAPSQ